MPLMRGKIFFFCSSTKNRKWFVLNNLADINGYIRTATAIYYKTGYVTTIEEQAVSQNQYDLVTDCMMESVLESISELHPLIKIYTDYLNSESEALNYYHERLFLNHDKEILHDSAAQKYLLDTLLENIAEDNWIIKIE